MSSPPFAPPPSSPDAGGARNGPLIPIVSNTLLYLLIACLATECDISRWRRRSKKLMRGIGIAMCLQFLMLPLIGFITVKMWNLSQINGVMLMIVVSSPGGAYSNWWCSLFNADLLLSVAATACSTVLSAAMLPLNLLIYLSASYGTTFLSGLRWDLLLLSIGVITLAVISGLSMSRYLERHGAKGDRIRRRFYIAGNFAGLCLIVFSVVFSSVDEPVWDKPTEFYFAVATPCLIALLLSVAAGSLPCLRLSSPERVAVVIECLYQNTGIGASIALSVFSGSEASRAAGTPLFYGLCQMILIPIYVVIAWKLSCTYAPAKDPWYKVIRDSYQHHAHDGDDEEGDDDFPAGDGHTTVGLDQVPVAHTSIGNGATEYHQATDAGGLSETDGSRPASDDGSKIGSPV